MRDKIDDHRLVEDGLEDFHKRLVRGMDEIRVAILGLGERQHEAVREPLVVLFGANVGSPFEGANLFDLYLDMYLDVFRRV